MDTDINYKDNSNCNEIQKIKKCEINKFLADDHTLDGLITILH